MKTKIILLIAILNLTAVGCSQSDNSDKKTFTSDWHNYTVSFPKDWTAEKRPDDNTVYLIGPKIDSLSFSQDGAFGIKVFALPEAFTSEYTYEKNMESFKTDPTFKDFSIDKKTTILIDNKKAIRVVYSATVFGTETISLQYYLAIDKKLYIMGGSIPSNMLGKYEDLYDEIIKSMEFK